jgi:hypothetical protein
MHLVTLLFTEFSAGHQAVAREGTTVAVRPRSSIQRDTASARASERLQQWGRKLPSVDSQPLSLVKPIFWNTDHTTRLESTVCREERETGLCYPSFPAEGMQSLSPFLMTQFKLEVLITKWFSGLVLRCKSAGNVLCVDVCMCVCATFFLKEKIGLLLSVAFNCTSLQKSEIWGYIIYEISCHK